MAHWTDAAQAAAQRTRAETRMLSEPGLRDDMREPGSLLLRLNGYDFDLLLKPHPRDVRLWHVYRDGAPWIAATGVEPVWRAMQKEMAQPLGRRHW